VQLSLPKLKPSHDKQMSSTQGAQGEKPKDAPAQTSQKDETKPHEEKTKPHEEKKRFSLNLPFKLPFGKKKAGETKEPQIQPTQPQPMPKDANPSAPDAPKPIKQAGETEHASIPGQKENAALHPAMQTQNIPKELHTEEHAEKENRGPDLQRQEELAHKAQKQTQPSLPKSFQIAKPLPKSGLGDENAASKPLQPAMQKQPLPPQKEEHIQKREAEETTPAPIEKQQSIEKHDDFDAHKHIEKGFSGKVIQSDKIPKETGASAHIDHPIETIHDSPLIKPISSMDSHEEAISKPKIAPTRVAKPQASPQPKIKPMDAEIPKPANPISSDESMHEFGEAQPEITQKQETEKEGQAEPAIQKETPKIEKKKAPAPQKKMQMPKEQKELTGAQKILGKLRSMPSITKRQKGAKGQKAPQAPALSKKQVLPKQQEAAQTPPKKQPQAKPAPQNAKKPSLPKAPIKAKPQTPQAKMPVSSKRVFPTKKSTPKMPEQEPAPKSQQMQAPKEDAIAVNVGGRIFPAKKSKAQKIKAEISKQIPKQIPEPKGKVIGQAPIPGALKAPPKKSKSPIPSKDDLENEQGAETGGEEFETTPEPSQPIAVSDMEVSQKQAPKPKPKKPSLPVLGGDPNAKDEEKKQGATAMADEIYFAYAREKLSWLYEIYKIGGMTLDEFRSHVKKHMDAEANGPKEGEKEPEEGNEHLANLNKELAKKFKK
jgi:hypothetical protein